MLRIKERMLIAALLLSVALLSPSTEADELQRDLSDTYSAAMGGTGELSDEEGRERRGQFEAYCMEQLLAKYTEPEEHGRIYAYLTQRFLYRAPVMPDKAMMYAEKALECPIDPLDRLEQYNHWGSAIQIARGAVRGNELAVTRRDAAVPFLRGLREALDHNLPVEKPDAPPLMTVLTGRGPEEQLQKRRDEIKARNDAIRAIIYQRDMIDKRSNLESQITYMYSRFPFDNKEIEKLATEILDDKAAVERLMSKVSRRVLERLEEAGYLDLNELPDAFFSPDKDVDVEVPEAGEPLKKEEPVSAESNKTPTAPAVTESNTDEIDSHKHGPLILTAAAGTILLIIAVVVAVRRSRKAKATP